MKNYNYRTLYGLKLNQISDNHAINRNELRKLVIKKLWNEVPGKGNRDKTTHYLYYVERLSDNKRIFITRPAKGKSFDFVIHVEAHKFINGKDNPKHEDIIDDLKNKYLINLTCYTKIKTLVDRVFMCQDPDDILIQENIENIGGFSSELLLKVCKWFFIEQDICYWNYSGRLMLKEEFDKITLSNK